MANRRYQSDRRRYYYPDASIRPNLLKDDDSIVKNTLEEVVHIPPPNELESTTARRFRTKNTRGMPDFLNIFKTIKLDEIILIGLILVLLDEGIEDEILLVVLVYLLLSGRDSE